MTGLLRCDFFRKVEGCSGRGIEVVLEKGKIQKVSDWAKPPNEETLAEKLQWALDLSPEARERMGQRAMDQGPQPQLRRFRPQHGSA